MSNTYNVTMLMTVLSLLFAIFPREQFVQSATTPGPNETIVIRHHCDNQNCSIGCRESIIKVGDCTLLKSGRALMIHNCNRDGVANTQLWKQRGSAPTAWCNSSSIALTPADHTEGLPDVSCFVSKDNKSVYYTCGRELSASLGGISSGVLALLMMIAMLL